MIKVSSENRTLHLLGQSPSPTLEESQLIKDAQKCECIFFGHEPGSFLHNDFPSPLEFGNLNYSCATSAYEAQKFSGQPDLMCRFTTLNAEQAYALSAEKHLLKTVGWYEKRLSTMQHVLRAKFGENPDLLHMLVSTDNAYLSLHTPHKNMDPFWTNNCDGSGLNWMGRSLMIIRGENGGRGEVSLPNKYQDLLPQTFPKTLPCSLDKSDEMIFAEIYDLNAQINEDHNKTCTEFARRPENARNTRFKFNNFPYDATLVPLSSKSYINASYVLDKAFIGTQSPMPHAYFDFWSMVYEHNVPIVIMLNRLGDPGDDIYFPFGLNDNRNYGNLSLKLCEEPLFKTDPTWRQEPHAEEPHAIIHRKISIQRGEEAPRLVHHFQYQNWRDFSAGNERAAAYLVQAVNAVRVTCMPGPITIHCHAGVGRTAVMITLLDQFQQGDMIDIKHSVERQRSPLEGRCNSMMQSTDQYHFCYRTLRLLA